MQATVQKNGLVLLAKSVRDAAKIRVGDTVEIEATVPGKVVLRLIRRNIIRPHKPILNVKGFSRETLRRAYLESESDWDSKISTAIAAQRVEKFEE